MQPDLSIGDIIAQFGEPKSEEITTEVQGWFNEFTQWLASDYEKTVHPVRKPGRHASSLGKLCGRRRLLIAMFGENIVPNTAGNYFTYDVGHSLHWWWQERYLGPKQELWGDWVCMGCPCPTCEDVIADRALTRKELMAIYRRCSACRGTGGKVTRGLMPLECGCGKPWQEAVHYLELPVVNEELGYVGHTDGILLHKPKRRIFEFKTISPTEYEKLDAGPKTEHVIQAHAYMQPLGLDEALIVYENKGSQCKWRVNMFGQFEALTPKVIPFLIRFDRDIWNELVLRIHVDDMAQEEVQRSLNEGRRLDKEDVSRFPRVCNDSRCDLAARCVVSRECFHID